MLFLKDRNELSLSLVVYRAVLSVEFGVCKRYVGPMRVGYRSDQTKVQIIARLGR